jgi:hypothetical protein
MNTVTRKILLVGASLALAMGGTLAADNAAWAGAHPGTIGDGYVRWEQVGRPSELTRAAVTQCRSRLFDPSAVAAYQGKVDIQGAVAFGPKLDAMSGTDSTVSLSQRGITWGDWYCLGFG